MIALRDMPNTMLATYPPGHEKAGQSVDRAAVCACGRAFTQTQLSMRELEAAERMGVLPNIQRQIPDFFVPVFCPPCERLDLARQSRIADASTYSRTLPDTRRDIA